MRTSNWFVGVGGVVLICAGLYYIGRVEEGDLLEKLACAIGIFCGFMLIVRAGRET